MSLMTKVSVVISDLEVSEMVILSHGFYVLGVLTSHIEIEC